MFRLPVLALAALLLAPLQGHALTCHAFVGDVPGVVYAQLGPAALPADGEVRITYVGHSSFRIETAGGVSIVTDFFGATGTGGPPTVVTMNKAHETHYTSVPDPEIEHVLRGWGDEPGQPAAHQLSVGDVDIRNVTTDIRGWSLPEKDANSIFVFEIADLCIGHLGHLHHALGEEHYALLGRLDIVMAPVDGTWTLPIDELIEVLETLKSRIVLPMHAFAPSSMRRFADDLSDDFEIRVHDSSVLTVSLGTLPSRPVVLMMPSGPGAAFDD